MIVSYTYEQHEYLLKSDFLEDRKKDYFNSILKRESDTVSISESLKILSKYLYEYHKEKVVILIDEYDTPIQSGYLNGYYDKVIEFMRNFLSGVLKDNEYLQKGVLTGILRVEKESIFSGLNNLKVCTILKNKYSEVCGFLE